MQNHPYHQPVFGAPPVGAPAARPVSGVSALDAIKFPFSSPDWGMNLLLGFVLMIIPVLGPLALHGWEAEVAQRLARRHPNPIPKFDFNDFMHYLERGIGPFVVNLLITLPCVFVMYFGMIIAAVAGSALARGGGGGEIAGLAMMIVVLLIALGGGMFLSVLLNSGLTRAELTEQLGPSLSPGAIWRYGARTWGTFMVATLVFAPLAMGLILVGMALCFIGLYPAVVAVRLAAVHLRWQIYEDQLAKGGEILPLRNPPAVIPSEAPPPQAWAPPRPY